MLIYNTHVFMKINKLPNFFLALKCTRLKNPQAKMSSRNSSDLTGFTMFP